MCSWRVASQKNRQEFNLKGDRYMTTFVVPAGAPNRISGRNGQIYSTRVSEGRTVVDILPQDFESLLSGPLGKSWAKANPGLAVSLLAPEGVCSYSHDGAEFKVCDDGSVLVADHVATVLRCHGFRDAPSP
jgi:hypothetical protein